MAFGDAENDRTMLEFAGIGIAMGNASDTLKTIADTVTLSNNDDGIACSLGKHKESRTVLSRGGLVW